ncbi:UNVERIFIED_CONTAM: hypothetical protein HDU68_007954 [Siphonaria sp. JEL0065]|nr:hypothetical protein HDU68_007954 [Siphonaria sp. JEL0065]
MEYSPRPSTASTSPVSSSKDTLDQQQQQHHDQQILYKCKKIDADLQKSHLENEARKSISAANARKAESEAARAKHELDIKRMEVEGKKVDLDLVRLSFCGSLPVEKSRISSDKAAVAIPIVQQNIASTTTLTAASSSYSHPTATSLLKVGLTNAALGATLSITSLLITVCFKSLKKHFQADLLLVSMTENVLQGTLAAILVPLGVVGVGEAVLGVKRYLEFVFSSSSGVSDGSGGYCNGASGEGTKELPERNEDVDEQGQID